MFLASITSKIWVLSPNATTLVAVCYRDGGDCINAEVLVKRFKTQGLFLEKCNTFQLPFNTLIPLPRTHTHPSNKVKLVEGGEGRFRFQKGAAWPVIEPEIAGRTKNFQSALKTFNQDCGFDRTGKDVAKPLCQYNSSLTGVWNSWWSISSCEGITFKLPSCMQTPSLLPILKDRSMRHSSCAWDNPSSPSTCGMTFDQA